TETELFLIITIRIAGVQRRAIREKPDPGIVERYKETRIWVSVHVHTIVSAITNETRLRIHLIATKWALAVLHCEPFRLLCHVIDAGDIHVHLSGHRVGAVCERLHIELRDVRTEKVIGGEAAEQALRGHLPADPRPVKDRK